MADKYRSRQESTDSLDTSPSTAEEYSEDDKDGYDIDDYQIIKTVGTGTFGRVLLCRNKSTDEYGAMKVLNLADVIRLKQVEHVKNEKNILIEIRHPFIVNMLWCNRDDSCIYMLFEYVCGGELFSYLRNAGRFSTSTGNFYSTEIVSALEYLHSKSIVYRDLKPENLLLDKDGHLKITDFGFAKKLTDRTWTLCGTPEYLAPEIIQSKGHNKAVDWWALGILIYEMLAGYPPFYDDNPFGIYEKILSGKIEWPKHLDPVAKDLIKKLLIQDRTKRLGNMKGIGQAYTFLSNEYKKMAPLRVAGDVCDTLRRNMVDLATIVDPINSNITMCPIKAAAYSLYHWIPNHKKFAPYLPHGSYKIEISLYVERDQILMLTWYGKIIGIK